MQTAAVTRRSCGTREARSPKIKNLVATLLVVTFFVAGCGGGEETQNEGTQGQGTTEQTESTGAGAETTRAGGERTGSSGGNVMLSIDGKSGTRFSGTCSVGDEEYELDGEVPESFDYDLDGRQLECEIRQEGSGGLNVLLTGPGDRVEQQANTPGGSISLVYSDDGVSSSTSGTSSSSVNQVVSSSSSGGSSSSSSSSSR